MPRSTSLWVGGQRVEARHPSRHRDWGMATVQKRYGAYITVLFDDRPEFPMVTYHMNVREPGTPDPVRLLQDVYMLARKLVEERTLAPSYSADDEAWYTALEDARVALGVREKAPVCVYCGSVAPYGDPRTQWIDAHQSIFHRLYHSKIKQIRFLKSRRPG